MLFLLRACVDKKNCSNNDQRTSIILHGSKWVIPGLCRVRLAGNLMFSFVINAVLGEGGLSVSYCSKAGCPEQARNSPKKLVKDHPSVLSFKNNVASLRKIMKHVSVL